MFSGLPKLLKAVFKGAQINKHCFLAILPPLLMVKLGNTVLYKLNRPGYRTEKSLPSRGQLLG